LKVIDSDNDLVLCGILIYIFREIRKPRKVCDNATIPIRHSKVVLTAAFQLTCDPWVSILIRNDCQASLGDHRWIREGYLGDIQI
jgi:hypothetical protein